MASGSAGKATKRFAERSFLGRCPDHQVFVLFKATTHLDLDWCPFAQTQVPFQSGVKRRSDRRLLSVLERHNNVPASERRPSGFVLGMGASETEG